MRRIIAYGFATFLAFVSGIAVADYTILDSTGATKTVLSFVCATTKICTAHVLIKSDGTEIGTASAPVRTDPTGTTTQPVTANAGTNLNTSLLAIESGGNLASVVTQLGAVTASPTANTLADRLKTVNTTLGSPFQAGGNIGNTAFTANAGTNLNTSLLALESGGNLAQVVTDFGAPGATACASDTASCNLNQQMQRNNQRLTTINTTLGTPFQAGGSIGNTTFAATQATAANLNATVVGTGTFATQLTGATNNINNIAGTVSLPTGAATAANQATEISSLATIATNTGAAIPAGSALIGDINVRQGGTALSATNGIFSNILQGNVVLSATNGLFANQLQGNAVLSATNGTFANLLQGNAVLSVTNPVFNRSVAGATGGGTISSAIAPATPAGVNLKASAGSIFKVFATTVQATPVYIKFYNASSAPTCGSGTPVARFMVPVAATAANGAGTNIDIGEMGAAFGTGIGYCVTGALADNDTTVITANNTLVNIVWN